MKTYLLQEQAYLEKNSLNIKKCCKSLFSKMIHNWKTRSKLNTLSESQMKDVGLTSIDIYKEVNKPLWK